MKTTRQTLNETGCRPDRAFCLGGLTRDSAAAFSTREHHPADWDGDCRDDTNRYAPGELDEKFGSDGWEEVDMPE